MILGFRFLQISTSASSNNLVSLDPGGRAWNAPTIAGSWQGLSPASQVGPLSVVPWAVSHKHQFPPSCESCGLTPLGTTCPVRSAAHSAQALLLSMQSRISTMQSMRWKRNKPGEAQSRLRLGRWNTWCHLQLSSHIFVLPAKLVCKISSAVMMP